MAKRTARGLDKRSIALSALRKGYTVREVAEMVDVARSTVYAWRNHELDAPARGDGPRVSVWEEGTRLMIAIELAEC
jgi:transposase-like protein